MAQRTTIKVRFYELDPYRHLNHTVYFSYFETARVETLDAIGWGLGRLADEGYQFVVVDARARFEAPALMDDLLTVDTEVTEIRRTNAVWRQTMRRDDRLLATLEVRVAATDLSGRPTRMPAGLADAMCRHEAPHEEVSRQRSPPAGRSPA
jgi:acyl-CoA thioester hydrolase